MRNVQYGQRGKIEHAGVVLMLMLMAKAAPRSSLLAMRNAAQRM
jgi:hypothetical protein